MSAPYGIPSAVTPFPATERRHQEGPDRTESSTSYQVNPLKALDDRAKQSEEEKKLAEERRIRQVAIEDVQRQQAADELKALEQQQADRDAAMQKSQGTIDQWKGRLDKARSDYEAQPFPALFADQDSKKSAMFGLGMALAVFASGKSAHANAMLGGGGKGTDYVGEIIDQDIARQKDKIKGLSDRIVMARTGVSDANEARNVMLVEADAKGMIMAKKAAKLAESNLKAKGLSDADIKKHEAVIAADNKKLEYQEKIAGQIAGSVAQNFQADTVTTRDTGEAGKPKPTESQNKDAFLGQQMLDNLKVVRGGKPLSQDALAKLQDNRLSVEAGDFASKVPFAAEVVGGLRSVGVMKRSVYSGLDPQEQRIANAMDEMVSLYARKLTGAGMPVSEANKAAQELNWHAGDSPELMQDKLARLEAVANQNMALSGPAGPAAASAARGGAEVAPPAAPARPAPTGNSMLELAKPDPLDAPPANPTAEDIKRITGGKVGGSVKRRPGDGTAADPRFDPAGWPGVSAPGPATETPANSLDNVNSEAPLPEDPAAPSIDDFQGKTPTRRAAPAPQPSPSARTAAPPVATAGPALTARQRIVEMLRANPDLQNPTILKRYNITPEELR